MPLKPFFSNLFRSLRHSFNSKPTAELALAPGRCPICKQPEALRWRDFVLELYDNCRFLNHYLAVEEAPFIPSAELGLSRSSPTPRATLFPSAELAFRSASPTPQVNPYAPLGEPNFYIQFPSLLQNAIRFHRPAPARLHASSQTLSHTPRTQRPLTTSAATAPTPISTSTYHSHADAYIDALVLELEELQEDCEDVDCEYTAGVLTLTFPPNGTYVLNKQPPNKQIWLSSPLSGPKRYDYVADDDGAEGRAEGEERGQWVYLRDGSTLTGLLRRELGIILEALK